MQEDGTDGRVKGRWTVEPCPEAGREAALALSSSPSCDLCQWRMRRDKRMLCPNEEHLLGRMKADDGNCPIIVSVVASTRPCTVRDAISHSQPKVRIKCRQDSGNEKANNRPEGNAKQTQSVEERAFQFERCGKACRCVTPRFRGCLCAETAAEEAAGCRDKVRSGSSDLTQFPVVPFSCTVRTKLL